MDVCHRPPVKIQPPMHSSLTTPLTSKIQISNKSARDGDWSDGIPQGLWIPLSGAGP